MWTIQKQTCLMKCSVWIFVLYTVSFQTINWSLINYRPTSPTKLTICRLSFHFIFILAVLRLSVGLSHSLSLPAHLAHTTIAARASHWTTKWTAVGNCDLITDSRVARKHVWATRDVCTIIIIRERISAVGAINKKTMTSIIIDIHQINEWFWLLVHMPPIVVDVGRHNNVCVCARKVLALMAMATVASQTHNLEIMT